MAVYRSVIEVDDSQSLASAKRSAEAWKNTEKVYKGYASSVEKGFSQTASKASQTTQRSVAEEERLHAGASSRRRKRGEDDAKWLEDQEKKRVKLHRQIDSDIEKSSATLRKSIRSGFAKDDKEREQASAAKIKGAEKEAEELQAIQDRMFMRDYQRRGVYLRQQQEREEAAKQKEVDDSWKVYNERSKIRTKNEIAEERATAKAQERHAKQAGSVGKIGLSWRSVLIGIYACERAGRAFGEAVDKAAQRSEDLAKSWTENMDKMRELAALKDRPLDTAFGLEQAQMAKQMLMKPEEANAFETALRNAGAESIGEGRKISEQEAKAFTLDLGKFTTARGLDPAAMGEFGGIMLGTRDWNKLGGHTAAREAMLNFAVLQHGRGGNRQLAQQEAKILAAYYTDDETKSAFKSIEEGTQFTSAFAEFDPEKGNTMTRSVLNTFGRYDSDLLLGAGVKPGQSPIEKAERIRKFVLAEHAKRQKTQPGITVTDVLGDIMGGGNAKGAIMAREAMGVLINKGAGPGGTFQERAQYRRRLEAPGVLEKELAAFAATPAGQERFVDAAIMEAEKKQGAELQPAEIARKTAMLHLIQQRKFRSTEANIENMLKGTFTFNALGDQEKRQIDQQVLEDLRGQGATFGLRQRGPIIAPATVEERNTMIMRGIEEVNGKLLKRMDGEPPPPLRPAPANGVVAH